MTKGLIDTPPADRGEQLKRLRVWCQAAMRELERRRLTDGAERFRGYWLLLSTATGGLGAATLRSFAETIDSSIRDHFGPASVMAMQDGERWSGEEHVQEGLTIARIALRLGQVQRATQHEDGEPESDATHTVMLALLAMEVAPRVGCDAGLAVQFAVVHDLPEVYAGDTNTARPLSAMAAAAKAEREAAAVRWLAARLGEARIVALLQRYEAQREPEARLVRYLDKVLPKLTHYLNRGSALRAIGLTADDVRESHALQGAELAARYPEMEQVGQLFTAACALVEGAIASGEIQVAPEHQRGCVP